MSSPSEHYPPELPPASRKGECLISVAGRKLSLHEESVNSGTSELRTVWLIQFVVVVFVEVTAVTSSGIKNVFRMHSKCQLYYCASGQQSLNSMSQCGGSMIHRNLVLCCRPFTQKAKSGLCRVVRCYKNWFIQSECVLSLQLVTVMRVECKATPDYDKVYFWSRKSVPFRMTGNFHVDILFSVSNLHLLFQT